MRRPPPSGGRFPRGGLAAGLAALAAGVPLLAWVALRLPPRVAEHRVAAELAILLAGPNAPRAVPGITGWPLVDEVDCAEPASEAAHAYRVRAASWRGSPVPLLRVLPDPAAGGVTGDGGWLTDGGETFRVSARPGRPLVLLLRARVTRRLALQVEVNGGPVETVPLAAAPERFQAVLAAQVPASRVSASNLVTVRSASGDGRVYESYHYWAFQPGRVPSAR
jgi:hypothetical protein